MITIRSLIGDIIKENRVNQNRSLQDVSKEAFMSRSYLFEAELGRKEMSSEVLASVCHSLDIDMADLYAELSEKLR